MTRPIISGSGPTSPEAFRELFGSMRVLWFNTAAAYIAGLARWCPVEAVFSVDDGTDLDLIARRYRIRFHNLEQRSRRRSPPVESLMEQIVIAFDDVLGDLLESSPPTSWLLVSPRPCQALTEYACRRSKPAVVCPAELGAWLYDKANFFSGLELAGLPRLPGRWLRLSETSYRLLSGELGARFVVQTPDGSSGSGTAFVFSEENFRSAGARLGDSLVWAAPYAGPLSLNINAVALGNAILTGYPSVQLVGVSELRSGPGMYCGNDFAATAGIAPGILDAVFEQTERIGRWLIALGYRGLFGLDFVADLDSSRVYAVDLNPRWQGSTALSTQAEGLAGRMPLAAAELAYRAGVLGESDLLALQDGFREPLCCAQMVLHSDRPNGAVVEGEVRPGIYRNRAAPVRISDGFELADCSARGQYVVGGGVVRAGNAIDFGAVLGRILSRCVAYDVDRSELLPWARTAANGIASAFALSGGLPGCR